jgi:subtilisin family serine protease
MTERQLSPRASISLQIMEDTADHQDMFSIVRPLSMPGEDAPPPDPKVPVIVEAAPGKDITAVLNNAQASQVEDLGGGLWSAFVPVRLASTVYDSADVSFVEAQKQKKSMLEKALVDGVVGLPNARKVAGRGSGVVVGIIDSGFDLSHPAFRDAAGALRVDALLVQSVNGADQEFTTAQLQAGWADGGARPGFDDHGHGTHVASIAAGSEFAAMSGVATDARLVLVKTDFIRLAQATRWCFDKAAGRPAVVNMSLGGHHNGHDGATIEERALERLSGTGRIIVAAAGNERADNIHIGTRFAPGQSETAIMDISTREGGATIVCWYNENDVFDVALLSPSGQVMAAPALNREQQFVANGAAVRIGRIAQANHQATEVLINIRIMAGADFSDFKGWQVRVTCGQAALGRFDAWITGESRFRDSAFVETARTIGMPATARRVIAVASHVTKNAWRADAGNRTAPTAVVGRSSRFSSRGPTRDGREKPEISAPGEMITAALAEDSRMSANTDRANTPKRLLTIEGTSMATPFVTGAIALMLERQPQLTPEDVIAAFQATAVKDQHTGPANWTPDYGHGKISALAAVNHVVQMGAIAAAGAVAMVAAPVRLEADLVALVPAAMADAKAARGRAAKKPKQVGKQAKRVVKEAVAKKKVASAKKAKAG